MGYQTPQAVAEAIWDLAERQHGAVARCQLLALGMHPQAIKHRVASRRLHPVMRGIYAIGRPRLTQRGRWMAAVLACGPHAVLSHHGAARLWEIGAHLDCPWKCRFLKTLIGGVPASLSIAALRFPPRTSRFGTPSP